MTLIRRLLALTPTVACLLLASCSKPEATPAHARPWRAFVSDLTNVAAMANLDVPGTKLLSTYDPAGGNDDFSRFAGNSKEPGWVVIADLKGPGCVRRFWTTGEDPGHRFKLYFDGEKEPRISGDIDTVFGGKVPFTSPLAHYLNLCWYSYVPLTYQKSLRIETEAPPTHPLWGPRRLFYQLNVETFTNGIAVESFPRTLSAEDTAAIEAVAKAWLASVEWPTAAMDPAAARQVAPGTTQVVFEAKGPATITSLDLHIEPADPSTWTQVDKEFLLQDTLLQVSYDDERLPSIEVPLGDFFGNAWRQRDYGSLLLGANSNLFHSAMPMPFASSIRIEVVNGANKPLAASASVTLAQKRAETDGYLHAVWNRSGPQPGTPHVFADFEGRGKFVGAYLGVTGQENSWWILEGDEVMFIDGEGQPSWHGTGLEDYFNGGWYYRGAAFAALHGIMDRSPIRTAQYRHQLVDPVRFDRSFHMEIERGDQNVSVGHFRSVAYAYLDKPRPAKPAPPRDERRAEESVYARQTTMIQLFELERMNNFRKAYDLLAEYQERYPQAPENGLFKLRQLEYRRLQGLQVGTEEYRPFVDGVFGPQAAEEAALLTWFYEDPSRAIVGAYANGEEKLYLNGKDIVTADHPFKLFTAKAELTPGAQLLTGRLTWRRDGAWFMAGVRTHNGFVGSGPDTEATRTAPAAWASDPSPLATWSNLPIREIHRGVPDAPMVGGIPNAMVLMQSKAYPLSAPDWAYYRDTVYYRIKFTTPLDGWPSFSRKMTGLTM
jgi:hypothetical protein